MCNSVCPQRNASPNHKRAATESRPRKNVKSIWYLSLRCLHTPTLPRSGFRQHFDSSGNKTWLQSISDQLSCFFTNCRRTTRWRVSKRGPLTGLRDYNLASFSLLLTVLTDTVTCLTSFSWFRMSLRVWARFPRAELTINLSSLVDVALFITWLSRLLYCPTLRYRCK